jgi:FtsP/CotA-like multicopper oxidase with cupredoxin domain
MTWRLGGRHRLRFLNMGLAVSIRPVITMGKDTLTWRAIAKDGADLPPSQQVTGPARATVSVGETADFEFTPPRRGEYLLTLAAAPNRPPVVQRIVVR